MQLIAPSGSMSDTLPIVISGDTTFSLGAEEVVFRCQTDRCEDLDLPDVQEQKSSASCRRLIDTHRAQSSELAPERPGFQY